ncbi:ferredoxin [Amycolatopsis methanolica]|uniref:ferredoxin n=1 Tax=Amycolatopsis methanolica TaxID=1814 RepID=UPI003412BF04
MDLRVDWDKCQGHGKCYLIAPELFQPDEEDDWGRARVLVPVVKGSDTATFGRAREAVSLCPEFAIRLDSSVPAE